MVLPYKYFCKLPAAQQEELKNWAATNPRTKENGGKNSSTFGRKSNDNGKRKAKDQGHDYDKKKLRGMISSIIAEAHGKDNEPEIDMTDAIAAMVSSALAKEKQKGKRQSQVGATEANAPDGDFAVQAKVAAGTLLEFMKPKKGIG